MGSVKYNETVIVKSYLLLSFIKNRFKKTCFFYFVFNWVFSAHAPSLLQAPQQPLVLSI